MPDNAHNHDIGRLEAQVEALFIAATRIEAKLDTALTSIEQRVRETEKEMFALRRLGGIVAVLWGSIIAFLSWAFSRSGS